MIKLKNKKTGSIAEYGCPQGQYNKEGDWVSNPDLEEPTKEEIKADELKKTKIGLIQLRKSYLKKTDQELLREIEEPGKCPVEIKNKRILARKQIKEIENATEETINNYLTFEE